MVFRSFGWFLCDDADRGASTAIRSILSAKSRLARCNATRHRGSSVRNGCQDKEGNEGNGAIENHYEWNGMRRRLLFLFAFRPLAKFSVTLHHFIIFLCGNKPY
jgi:hypothetical protein